MRPVAAVVLGRRFGENGGDSIVGMVEGGPEARQREAVQPPVKKYFYINDLSTLKYSFQLFDHTFMQVYARLNLLCILTASVNRYSMKQLNKYLKM
jgi:hypothetical protein